MAIRVLVADDHAVVRAGLAALLASTGDFDVVGEAATEAEIVRLADEVPADVVIMDILLPDGDGIEATRQICARHLDLAVLILSMIDNGNVVRAAFDAGAHGYVLKGADQHRITCAIASVAAGQVTLDERIAKDVLGRPAPDQSERLPYPQLTRREREILCLVAEGHNNTVIAERLGLRPKTIANQVSNILTKLQFSDRVEAIVESRRVGITDRWRGR